MPKVIIEIKCDECRDCMYFRTATDDKNTKYCMLFEEFVYDLKRLPECLSSTKEYEELKQRLEKAIKTLNKIYSFLGDANLLFTGREIRKIIRESKLLKEY